MANLKKDTIIKEVSITLPGDPPVGVPSQVIEIKNFHYDTGCVTHEEIDEDVEFIRETLRKCFSEIYDDKAIVTFDFERGK